METSLDFIFTILESIGTFLMRPPFSIFLAIIFVIFAIKIIKVIVDC